MQQVEADATAAGIEDGLREQVIEIDQIRGNHDQAGSLPMLAPNHRSDQKRHEPVSAVVQNGLKEVYASIQSRKKLMWASRMSDNGTSVIFPDAPGASPIQIVSPPVLPT